VLDHVSYPLQLVIPAQAGIQLFHDKSWIPACAGMTGNGTDARACLQSTIHCPLEIR